MSNVVRTFAQLEAVCLAAGCVVGFCVGLVQVWRGRRT